MNNKFLLFIILVFGIESIAQKPKGALFIIGGGGRPPELMKAMLNTAQLGERDYIIVLPMSSSQPDSAYYYFKQSLNGLTSSPVINFSFSETTNHFQPWLDSLRNAKLVFITGGDQSRFMKSVLNTLVFNAIHDAYKNGATIAGTSAGAAVMSKYMITGNELIGNQRYQSTFVKVWQNNIELEQGLGLLENVVVDQHFIARSRYNRLLSVIAKFPDHPAVGIDEATAIIVKGRKATVTGKSQVVVISKPKRLRVTDRGLIKFENLRFSMYTDGDSFNIK
ncbi:MAG TPA: cyanophycinase [Chitinophagaceae bacterium]